MYVLLARWRVHDSGRLMSSDLIISDACVAEQGYRLHFMDPLWFTGGVQMLVRKRFCAILHYAPNLSPREARDKHRKS